jgi:RNA polymerase sigma-70 factor (ECF subfamily)
LELLNTTNDELVDRCRNGDPSAYTALYKRHSRELYNTIYRLVNDTFEAEDLLQETFVSAFQGIDKLQYAEGFRAWIKRIAINKSISWLRKKKLQFVELEIENVNFKEEAAVNESEFAFKVEDIQRAISELPDGYRTIVQLHLFENISHVKIGSMLGLADTNVRIQYHRAKQRILQTLRKEEYYDQ